jgi:hypothetical protein
VGDFRVATGCRKGSVFRSSERSTPSRGRPCFNRPEPIAPEIRNPSVLLRILLRRISAPCAHLRDRRTEPAPPRDGLRGVRRRRGSVPRSVGRGSAALASAGRRTLGRRFVVELTDIVPGYGNIHLLARTIPSDYPVSRARAAATEAFTKSCEECRCHPSLISSKRAELGEGSGSDTRTEGGRR